MNSNALRIPLILPNSPESPTYIKNITRTQTIKNLVYHSRNRVRSIYYSETSNGTSKFTHSKWALRQELHVTYPPLIYLQLGIGTFNKSIPYKSYYVQMDTSSEIIWVQCEDCQKQNKCFGNPPELFKNTKSNSYDPIPCDTHRLCYRGKCKDGFCSYNTHYADGFSVGGILAFETFNFAIGPLWGPRSLMSQIKTQIEDIFSYCFPHYDESALGIQGYLKLGLEGNLEDDFSSTALQQFEDSDYYYLNLEGISVNNEKLPILPSVFIRKNNGKGGTIIDSGNPFTDLTPRAYKVLKKTLLAYFRSLGNNYKRIRESKRKHEFDLCYTTSRYRAEDLPSITFNFAGSDLVLKSENVFIWLDNPPSSKFCLAIFPGEENLSVLGAYQQSNFKFVYDRRRMLLLFKREDHCHQDT
ncbi:hypothetical protein RND81_10G206400 [Saponaria officinalis]|uniref:Peptidase A1 domain-containing protein n=1 Tax=Saponaria officinalis TaxID=3572 RepID=A0AAW1I722_SAPOF